MEDADDPNVGFLFKTMLSRDPMKRRVKPVQKHLLSVAFGLDDSEDDDDFKIPDNQDSGDSDIESSADNETNDDDDNTDEDDDNKDEEQEKSDGDSVSGNGKTNDDISAKDAEDEVSCLSAETRSSNAEESKQEEVALAISRQRNIKICCVCLEDKSKDDDEMIECDSCGLAVHEGCHGVCDTASNISTGSSASTEPWFCDACKAGVSPHCELCPNEGGVFKETDTGKWVHLVCALYIPGVAFGDVERLKCVTLHEMPMTKFGAKACSLCEDVLLSRTGICISCDAGMCRNFFHATCAQREGLLSEALNHDDVADPFFAHCKQHADKAQVKARRCNYLMVQSSKKTFDRKKESATESKARIVRKLEAQRTKYDTLREKNFSFWYPNTKVARFLTSSARAVKRLRHKAELLGVGGGEDVDGEGCEVQHPHVIQQEVQRKWHLPPAFSMEFVAYYLDRGKRIDKFREKKRHLVVQKGQLQAEEKKLRATLPKLQGEVDGLNTISDGLKEDVHSLWSALRAFSNKPLKTPAILDQGHHSAVNKVDHKSGHEKEGAILHACATCKCSTEQHLLVYCDTCCQHYHLGCLDPPLTRVPKKSKLFSWQCSNCAPSSTDESAGESSINTQAPMKLRENIKLPQKFINELERLQTKPGKRSSKKKVVQKKRRRSEEEESCDEGLITKKVMTETQAGSSKGKTGPGHVCASCGEHCSASTSIRCRKCNTCYHRRCVDQKVQSSVKWTCPACHQTSEEESLVEGTAEEHVDEAPYFVLDD